MREKDVLALDNKFSPGKKTDICISWAPNGAKKRFTSFQAHLSLLIFKVSVLSLTLSGVLRWDEERNVGMWSSELGRASSSSRGILSVSRQFFIYLNILTSLRVKFITVKVDIIFPSPIVLWEQSMTSSKTHSQTPSLRKSLKKEFLVPSSIYCFNHIKLN